MLKLFKMSTFHVKACHTGLKLTTHQDAAPMHELAKFETVIPTIASPKPGWSSARPKRLVGRALDQAAFGWGERFLPVSN